MGALVRVQSAAIPRSTEAASATMTSNSWPMREDLLTYVEIVLAIWDDRQPRAARMCVSAPVARSRC
jgi:hypothetical protein